MDFRFLKQIKYHTWIAILAAGFFGASLWTSLTGSETGVLFTEQAFLDELSMGYFLLRMLFGCLIIIELVLLCRSTYPAYISLFFITTMWAWELSYIVGKQSFEADGQADITFMLGIGIVVVMVTKYLTAGDKLKLARIAETDFFTSIKKVYGLVCIAVALFVIVVSYVSIRRYMTFTSSTYDFGIFAQMFEKMRTTGKPLTTVERGEVTSHFSVHFSPTWYILLPGYMVFSTPIYLYIANALIIGLGAFPVFRIAEKLGESHFNSVIFAVIYLLFPTMSAGTLWDIHENSFLPVLILYMVYFFLEQKTIPMCIFALLVLGTKEDAALYLLAFGLYVLFAMKDKRRGLILIVMALIYFLFATRMVACLGGEVMTDRYSNYNSADAEGFKGIVKSCLTDIGYVIHQSFSSTSDKLTFILWMLVPVLFAPFLSKRNSLLLLLIPMLVVNLMSYWTYQSNVYFQYTYGPAALIILASLFAFHGWKKHSKNFYVITAFVVSLCLCSALFWSKATRYLDNYSENTDKFKASQEAVEKFLNEYYQEGDSVSAQCFLTPHLYEVDELYTLPAQYSERQYTDWYILDEEYQSEDEYPADVIEQYECVNPEDSGFVRIYRKQQ